MKKFLLILPFFLFNTTSFVQNFNETYCGKKLVNIHVDVLGVKQSNIRYYHPINGSYKIRSRTVGNKKMQEALQGYLLIEPVKNLIDSETDIQANSLRYYIDPTELIYVNWAMGSDTSNEALLDTFKIKSLKKREEKYQNLIEDYFDPFYISKYEVTNKEYREFVKWVQDSLFREAIYVSEYISNEEALEMLSVPKDVLKEGTKYDEFVVQTSPIASEPRSANRESYPLNWDYDYWEELRDDQIIPSISSLYLRQNERFYTERQVDTKNLIYRYYDVDIESLIKNRTHIHVNSVNEMEAKDRAKFILDTAISIYPDTTCWSRLTFMPFNESMMNLYFWHPAYDNYPVVGVSYDQAKAFCHWKQRQLKKEHPEIARHFKFDLPRIYEYEWAISGTLPYGDQNRIQDNEITTSLILGESQERRVDHHESFLFGEQGYTQQVNAPYPGGVKKYLKQKSKAKPQSKKEAKAIYNSNQDIENEQNHLTNGIAFLSNNISEWMDETYKENYSKLVEAYVNYNCFANPTYCEHQRHIDQNMLRINDTTGYLIMGGNWYDERYGSYLGINVDGLYPKIFRNSSKKFSTVGFRCVIRYKR